LVVVAIIVIFEYSNIPNSVVTLLIFLPQNFQFDNGNWVTFDRWWNWI